jgi:hypothetical protein
MPTSLQFFKKKLSHDLKFWKKCFYPEWEQPDFAGLGAGLGGLGLKDLWAATGSGSSWRPPSDLMLLVHQDQRWAS